MAEEEVTGPASYLPPIEKTDGQPIDHGLDLVRARPADEKHNAIVAYVRAEG